LLEAESAYLILIHKPLRIDFFILILASYINRAIYHTSSRKVFLDIVLLCFSLLHKVGIDNHDVTLEMDIVPKALLYEEEFKGRLTEPYGGFYLTWCLIN